MNLLNRKGQNTAEYAVLIAVVIGAIVAMQLYVKRGLQAKVKDVTDNVGQGLVGQVPGLAAVTSQYEPYYNTSNYDVASNQKVQEKYQAGGTVDRTSVAEETIRTGNSTTGVDTAQDDNWK